MTTIHKDCTNRNNFIVYFSSSLFACHDFQLNFSAISLLDGMLNETYWGLSHSELNSRQALIKTAYIKCITFGTGWASAKLQTLFWLVSFLRLPYSWDLNLTLTVWVLGSMLGSTSDWFSNYLFCLEICFTVHI